MQQKRCPYCGSHQSWNRRSQRGVRRYSCVRCKRWFSERYTKGHHKLAFLKKIVKTYFDTRGSYRRTAKSIDYELSHVQIFRIIEKLGRGCKDATQVATELRPRWSGILGLDGKTIGVRGENKVLADAVDLGSQDSVDSALVASEDYPSFCSFLKEVRDEIRYRPKMLVIDDDRVGGLPARACSPTSKSSSAWFT